MTTHPMVLDRRSGTARPAGAGKRALDVLVAALALLLLAPLLAVVALAIRTGSSGPAVFRQLRGGRGGREFGMWKFRTMVDQAEHLRPALLARSREQDWLHLERDPRVTRLGRVLRRTSVDELPQLVNVLRGEMSLVGPRPLPLEEHARIPAWAQERTLVRPGLTGLWQVSGRTRLSFTEMLALDCRYVRERSLWLDVKILLRTLPAVTSARGAN